MGTNIQMATNTVAGSVRRLTDAPRTKRLKYLTFFELHKIHSEITNVPDGVTNPVRRRTMPKSLTFYINYASIIYGFELYNRQVPPSLCGAVAWQRRKRKWL